MSIHQILHSLLSIPLLVLVTSCESDATGIFVVGGQQTAILSCIISQGDDITVHVYGSASYSDTARLTIIDGVTVTATINGAVRQFAYMPEGQTSVTLPPMTLEPDETVTISARAPSIADEVYGSTQVMPQTRVERLDTLSLDDSQTLRLTAYLRDSTQTDDFYQIEVGIRSWVNSDSSYTTLNCQYLSTAFVGTTSSLAASVRSLGIFDDTRLQTLPNGLSPVTLTASWPDIRLAQWAADSAALIVTLHHISQDYYTFLQTSAQAQNYLFLPIFSTSSVHTNVSGGLGLVGSSTQHSLSLILPTDTIPTDSTATLL